MMTPAELFLETLKKDGKPERQLKQYEALGLLVGDPISSYLNWNRAPGAPYVDRWGVTMILPVGAPGATPHITPENKVIKDITRWRDYVHAPNLKENCSEGWEKMQSQTEKIHAEGKLTMRVMGGGMFEQTHYLMGFEDALTNFYEHPQEMHELIDYIFEYRMEYLKMMIDGMHPDVILSHDDWGTKTSLFMQPDIWREFYKEPYRKFYKYMRDSGVIAVHHADSYLVPIVEDMVELGIQAWQGTLPENNVPLLLEQLDGRMTLIGGVGAVIDTADSTEEQIKSYVKQVLEDCAPRGHFIPCITYGTPGTVFKHVDPVIDAAIEEYNQELHIRNYRPAAPVHRTAVKKVQAAAAAEIAEETGDILEQIASALQKGKKKKVLNLCQDALAQGIDAQTIVNSGLVLGMSRLGDDFSANRAYVPEMLLAGKCMAAATDMMKDQLAGSSSAKICKVALGTVKGDMHDIGKNLVKIMMEGSGFEVVDLGSDVPPEKFMDAVINGGCRIIACSTLLTTTMPEMKNVVEMAKEKGVRDDVIIMIGGAPVSQSYCDEIGADLYTPDAAAAAKAAIRAFES